MTIPLTLKLNLALLFLILSCGSIIYFSGAFFQKSWEKVSEDTHSHAPDFLSVFFFDSKNGLAITFLEIKQTADSGKTWKTIYQDEDLYFTTLIFTDEQNGWVVGSDGDIPLVLKTNDKGEHWQRIDFDENTLNDLDNKFNNFFNICFTQTGKGWIVGDGGIVEVLTNESVWKISNIVSTQESIFSVDCKETGEVWAVGRKSTVFNNKNGWVKQEIEGEYLLTKVKSAGNNIWILGGELNSQGILLKSQDGGESWENNTPESANTLFDIVFRGNQGWLVGANGNIFNSNDFGNSWVKVTSPTQNNLTDIFFLDAQNGWICGTKSIILKY